MMFFRRALITFSICFTLSVEQMVVDPEAVIVDLEKALTGGRIDTDKIEKILLNCPCDQRKKIREKYDEKFNHHLIPTINTLAHRDYKHLLKSLFVCGVELQADLFDDFNRKNMESVNIMYPLIMITESKDIKREFLNIYGSKYPAYPIRKQIKSQVEGDLKSICFEMLDKERRDVDPTNAPSAAQIAQDMKNSRKDWGDNRKVLDAALLETPLNKTREILAEFQKLNDGKSLYDEIDNFGRNKREAYRSLIAFIENPPRFYARVIHRTMDGFGTHEKALTDLILYCSEKNMAEVKDQYQQMYDHSLERDINGDTSGPYRSMLLAFLSLPEEEIEEKEEGGGGGVKVKKKKHKKKKH